MSMATIVVGVDGSPASNAALRLAVDEATLRRMRVLIVTCWSSELHRPSHGTSARVRGSLSAAQKIAHDAVVAVDATSDERALVDTSTPEGDAGHELVHASRHSGLLVIGSTTRQALARRTGKTVVDHCLRFSDVPVLVVPYTPTRLDQRDIDRELQGAHSDEGADIAFRYDPFAVTSLGTATRARAATHAIS